MINQRLVTITAVFCLIASFIAGAAAQHEQSGRASDHNRQGLQYFNEAFYKQLPKGKQQEAEQYFDLAAAEFKKALAANPKNVDAHRNLARLYYVRKDFPQAIDAYRMVTILEPRNIDAYLQLALSYTRVERFEEAVGVLEAAKTNTDDPEVLGKLNGYIRKIRERE